MPAILLAEIRKRDWLFYAIVRGSLRSWCSASSGTRLMKCTSLPKRSTSRCRMATQIAATDPSLALLVIGAGMFGGIGYWLIAGRSAGVWWAAEERRYFVCAVMIFSAKAENTPANR